MQEKKLQLDRVKELGLRIQSQQSTIDNLDGKAQTLIRSSRDGNLGRQIIEVVSRYQALCEKAKALQDRCEKNLRDHQVYRDAYMVVSEWLGTTMEKLNLCSDVRGDRSAIEAQLHKVEEISSIVAVGKEKLREAEDKGSVVLPHTSQQGQELIKEELSMLRADFEGFQTDLNTLTDSLSSLRDKWQRYEAFYEELNQWIKDTETDMKSDSELKATLEQKAMQLEKQKSLHEELMQQQESLDKLAEQAQVLMQSSTDSRVATQLTQISSRYSALITVSKDLLKRYDQTNQDHQHYSQVYSQTRAWLQDTYNKLSVCSDTTGDKSTIQTQLDKLQEFVVMKEEGQVLIHTANTWGEKTMTNTAAEGREVIRQELQQLQSDWEKMLSHVTDTKVMLESCLMQWTDFSASHDQVVRWLKDMEKRLRETHLKADLSEKKAELQRCKTMYQDVVSYEQMVESMTNKATDLVEKSHTTKVTTDTSGVMARYNAVKEQAKELLAKNEQYVAQHQMFHDCCNSFINWLRTAVEKMATCSDTYGEKSAIETKLDRAKTLLHSLEEGNQRLDQATMAGETTLPSTSASGQTKIRQELQIMARDFEDFRTHLVEAQQDLETCLSRWDEYEESYQQFSAWLREAEIQLRAETEHTATVEEKKRRWNDCQGQLEELVSQQSSLDVVSEKAQVLLQTNADAKTSHAITQLNTRYQAVIALAKDLCNSLESAYNHHRLYKQHQGQFCDWLQETRQHIHDVQDVRGSKDNVNSRLTNIQATQAALDHGHSLLRSLLDSAEKTLPSTNPKGCQVIRQETESAKTDYENILTELSQVKRNLEAALSHWDDYDRLYQQLVDWVTDTERRLASDPELKSDLPEKRSCLEKYKALQVDITSHKDLIDKLNDKAGQVKDGVPQSHVSELQTRYAKLQHTCKELVGRVEDQVKDHEEYRRAHISALDWLANMKHRLQRLSDFSGDKHSMQDRLQQLQDFKAESFQGKDMVDRCASLADQVCKKTAPRGQDVIRKEVQSLRNDWAAFSTSVSDVESNLQSCIANWLKLDDEHTGFMGWLERMDAKVKALLEPRASLMAKRQQLQEGQDLYEEIVKHRGELDKVRDKGDSIVQRSSDPRLSSSMMQLYTKYQALSTSAKSMVSMLKDNVEDHKLYDSALDSASRWLVAMTKRVAACSDTSGDWHLIQDNIEDIKMPWRRNKQLLSDVTACMDEGLAKVNCVCDQAEKIMPNTAAEGKKLIEQQVTDLTNEWETLNTQIANCSTMLEGMQQRWHEYDQYYDSLLRWLTDTEATLHSTPEPKALLLERKAQLDKYKLILSDVENHRRLVNELTERGANLEALCDNVNVSDSLDDIQSRFNALLYKAKGVVEDQQRGYDEHMEFHEAQQESEKWLLQMSFRLMAHNSLNVSSMELTERQIDKHKTLLREIEDYRLTLNSVRRLGQQVMQHNAHTPRLLQTVQAQLDNLEDSYSSLQATASQIRDRLNEILGKWQQYKDLLDSTNTYLTHTFPAWLRDAQAHPPDSLQHAHQHREAAQGELEKLHHMREELQQVAQRCDTMGSTESLDKLDTSTESSSPLAQLAEQVHDSLTDCIHQLEQRLERLRDTIRQWENVDRARNELHNWLQGRQEELTDIENSPAKLHAEAADLDIQKLQRFREDVRSRGPAIEDLLMQYRTLTQHNPSLADPLVMGLREDWQGLLAQADALLAARQEAQRSARELQSLQASVDQDLEDYARELERIDKEESTMQEKGVQMQKFVDEVDQKRQGVEELRNKASELLPSLSQHDTQLVQEHMRTTERRYGELQASAERKQRSYGSLGEDLGSIKAEAEQYVRWLEDTGATLTADLRLGLDPGDVDQHLHHTQELSATLEEKQVRVEAVKQQAEALLHDLPGPERHSVDLMVRHVQAQHTQVVELVTMRCARLEESRQLRLDFRTSVSKEQDWVDGKVKAAEKLDAVRLLASDVDKQADKCKGLLSKVQARSTQLEELDTKGQQLKEGCTQEGAEQVDTTLTELKDQQRTLCERLKRQEDHLRNCAAARRLFESDCHKVAQWCRETDLHCGADLPCDCATQVLEEQVQQYKSLANTARLFESLVKETVQRGEGFKADLYENDLPLLEEQLASLQTSYDRTSQVVREQLQSLESSLSSRRQVEDSIESCRAWLEDMQDQINAADQPLGPDTQHAHTSLQQFEALEKLLADYQPTMAQLNSSVETLRAQGQLSQVDHILHLTSQHELLTDRVNGCRNNRQAALAVRQQHQSQLAEIEEALQESREQLKAVTEMGVAVPERLHKYKELQERLTKLDPKVRAAEDQAKQMAMDCPQEHRAAVLGPVEAARQDLGQLREELTACIQQCQQIQHDRDSFEAAVSQVVAWLEDKEDILASLRPLHLDSDKVDPVIEKHKATSSEAVQKLSSIRSKAEVELSHFQQLGEEVPQPFTEKVQQIDVLHVSIQEAIEKKQQYLEEAKGDREQLETSMRQVHDWLRGAEELLDSGYEGLDYNTVDNTLSEFTDYFSEASLCQDEMEQVTELSDKLLSTLDANDTQTLHQSLAGVNKRLAHVMATSNKKQQLLEGKTAQWHSFQEGSQELGASLDELEAQWEQVDSGPLSSHHDLTALLDRVRVFTGRLEERREAIGSLNETARSLIRSANPTSTATINRYLLTLNQRWDDLIAKAEGREATLDELQRQWQEFSSSVQGAEDVVSLAQDTMASLTALPDTQEELVERLEVLRTVQDDLDSLGPQVERLKMASNALQKTLPSAEAMVALQHRYLTLMESYDKLKVRVGEEVGVAQEEVEDRDNFGREVQRTLSWLSDTHTSLTAMDPEADDTQDNVERCKTYQQEITLRMNQMRRLTVLQETKYAALGRDLPQEMHSQLQDMQDLEKQVLTALREKREELIHLHEDREEYRTTLVKVSDWLHSADHQLQQRIVNIAQGRLAHQDLLSQFEEFKQQLDRLRGKGADIIRHSTDQAEKQSVQQTLASVNRRWLSLQAHTADRTQELSEAADLEHAVEDVAGGVDDWLSRAEGVVEVELDSCCCWTDLDSVREQLKVHQQLCQELEQNEDKLVALNAMVKQLDQVCDTTEKTSALAALRQRLGQVGARGRARLGQLQEAGGRMEEYQQRLQELRQWMEDTQARISMRDTTRDLKEQLAVQERLLEDIRSNKARTEEVVGEHDALGDQPGETTPSQGQRLLKEILELQEAAECQCLDLRAALAEQEQYETEVRHLNAAISEAQQKLLASPVRASTVQALKQQIAEHNSLASQIKAHQARVSEINEKSQQLSLRVAQASTVTSRKRYLPDMVYRNWVTASASESGGMEAHSSPVSSASLTLDSFDSGMDAGVNLSQSLQTSPSLSTTLQSHSPLSARPPGTTPRSEQSATTADFGRFKPILDSSRVDSSASFRSDESDSFVSQPGDTSVKTIRWSAPSEGLVDSYKVKSASDPRLHGSSLLKKSPGQGPDSGGVGKVTTLRSRLESPWSLSDHDRPAKTSTPRGRGWSESPAALGRRTLSHSPDKGGKSFQPPTAAPSLSPSPSALYGRGRSSSLHVASTTAAGGGVGVGRDVINSGLQGHATDTEEPRARSSSFGQKVEALGQPLGTVPRLEEMNQSWNTLQKQVSAKEKELQVALQKQEQYQQAVQEVTAKMERAQISLSRSPASAAANVDSQMKDFKDSLSELESIKEDMAVVRERGRQMIEVSDAEGGKAMQATLTMLSDRLTNLQSLADQKGKHLQVAVKDRKKHEVDLTAYKKRVTDLESWLGEMKVRHATTPLPTDNPSAIQHQLQDNKELQEDLNARLQQISDLAVQCDSLCEMETPSEADKLRKQLSGLHSRLGDFKLATIDKETSLRGALKDSEKRQKEMDDYESRVTKLQQWMSDTKQMTLPADSSTTAFSSRSLPDRSQLHQDLASDLSQHQQLVKQLSAAPRGAERGLQLTGMERKAVAPPTMSEAELHSAWEALQRDLALKTEQLESLLQRTKSGETVTPRMGGIGDTSHQLADIQSLVAQLSRCWQQLQVQVDDKQLRLDTALSFQQQMQSALTSMSSWLDSAEHIVLGPSSAQSEHDRLRQNEALQRELRSLQSEISTLSGQAQGLLAQSSGQSHGLIQESLTNLTQRVSMLERQAVSRSDQLRQLQHQWQQYHEDVRALRARMQELQSSIMGPPSTSTTTLDSLISNITKLETQLKKCEGQLDELKGRERELSSHSPRAVVPSELTSLRNTYMELQRKVGERKASLLQSVSVQEQYKKMLKDYADFLETAEGKLKTEAISARDLPHLKQQLSAHKEFFSDLEVHKAMVDSLCGQCDASTQDAHSMQHTRLTNLTHVLADQASLHGQRLERLVRQWSHLTDKLGHLRHFHAQVEEGIPKPIASGDSLATIQDKLDKFKRLQGQLSDERPTVFQAVDQGKQILHSVACPSLEAAITDLADKWVELNTQLVHHLKKTETIGEQLQIFEAEAMVLKTWMSTARMKLDDLQHLSEDDAHNIGNIRTKVEHILEFRKEVQNQLPLKSKVMSVGKQLMANRHYDTRGLDARLQALDQEWSQLEQSIGSAEQTLHQAQMELMPSRQALHELQLWMEEIEKALKADGNAPIKTLADIEVLLKKYKGYKVELASKQLTMDFVNQAVLQPGPHEVDIPHEKLDYADKLSELNQHWTKVTNDVNERLRSLEQLSGKWADYEAALAQLQAWFRQQEDKIKRYRLIGHEVGVKQTLKDCKAMQEQLQARKEDLESVKTLGQALMDLSRESPGCQRSVRESLSQLGQQWEHLRQQTLQLESVLTDMLGQWARYHADLHSLTQVLTQTEYTLNRYSLVGADLSTLVTQVEKLKSLERELKQHSSHLDSFSTLASQLCQVCESPVQSDVQATVSDLKTKWGKLSADLSTRRAQFERCLNKWREYEAEYEKISDWLSKKEAECNDLIAMREDVSSRQECLDKSEALQQELDEIQTQLSGLYRLSDELTKDMGTSTIVLLTSRQSALEQRLVGLRGLLDQHIQGLHQDLSQINRFRQAFSAVRRFLEQAGAVLREEDPGRGAEQAVLQSRLDRLKQLSAQFQANSGKLDEVNDLGYRLALDARDAQQLLEVNHEWHRGAGDCQERAKALQGHLLVQQDFTAKCHTWMAFLADTERDLATQVAGNLSDLLEQQSKCQKFESEMYSHQQVIQAIISDGQKMLRNGEVEDPTGFEHKLRLLSGAVAERGPAGGPAQGHHRRHHPGLAPVQLAE
ncbi:nesprin-1-like isoform X2 [Babylonia areolata]|uniref:nesprin-1-like isoform X2 n=1 Tax=Babylonia areolata TaxID=304850 RepID=UPI003FD29B51